jgi:hypothetical protein
MAKKKREKMSENEIDLLVKSMIFHALSVGILEYEFGSNAVF